MKVGGRALIVQPSHRRARAEARPEPAAVVNLREKGGKPVALPCRHNLEAYLHATGLASHPQGPLFRTSGQGTEAIDARVRTPRR